MLESSSHFDCERGCISIAYFLTSCDSTTSQTFSALKKKMFVSSNPIDLIFFSIPFYTFILTRQQFTFWQTCFRRLLVTYNLTFGALGSLLCWCGVTPTRNKQNKQMSFISRKEKESRNVISSTSVTVNSKDVSHNSRPTHPTYLV